MPADKPAAGKMQGWTVITIQQRNGGRHMLEELKKAVWNANLSLAGKGIVIYTWGNVSGISDDRRYMAIKPSGL